MYGRNDEESRFEREQRTAAKERKENKEKMVTEMNLKQKQHIFH